jgi:hypothetical protein
MENKNIQYTEIKRKWKHAIFFPRYSQDVKRGRRA